MPSDSYEDFFKKLLQNYDEVPNKYCPWCHLNSYIPRYVAWNSMCPAHAVLYINALRETRKHIKSIETANIKKNIL